MQHAVKLRVECLEISEPFVSYFLKLPSNSVRESLHHPAGDFLGAQPNDTPCKPPKGVI